MWTTAGKAAQPSPLQSRGDCLSTRSRARTVRIPPAAHGLHQLQFTPSLSRPGCSLHSTRDHFSSAIPWPVLCTVLLHQQCNRAMRLCNTAAGLTSLLRRCLATGAQHGTWANRLKLDLGNTGAPQARVQKRCPVCELGTLNSTTSSAAHRQLHSGTPTLTQNHPTPMLQGRCQPTSALIRMCCWSLALRYAVAHALPQLVVPVRPVARDTSATTATSVS